MPQRQRITVVCPHCGHRQDEPTMVVSTNCRRCRSHIEINDGKVVNDNSSAKPALGPSPEFRPAPPPPAPPPSPIRTRRPEQEPPAVSEPPPPPPPPSRPPLLAQLRHSLRPTPKTRNVLCNRCLREFTAPVAANATNCPGCGIYLLLHNFEIDEPWDEKIATRGNVVLLRHGIISDADVECHDFTLLGRLDTSVRCTGSFTIRRSGLIRGKIRCASLHVERRVKVEFIYPVETGTAIIHGEIVGSIRASGPVTLLKRSRVCGNITTPSLVVKPGARHTGKIRHPPPPVATQ